jgi:DeoR/GlpR family transcriptional regulator of sugar metabolism
MLVQEIAQLYGVSEDTLYRVLRELPQPKILRRADYGTPRVMPQTTLERSK